MLKFDIKSYLLTEDLPGGPTSRMIDDDFRQFETEVSQDGDVSVGQRIGVVISLVLLAAFIIYMAIYA